MTKEQIEATLELINRGVFTCVLNNHPKEITKARFAKDPMSLKKLSKVSDNELISIVKPKTEQFRTMELCTAIHKESDLIFLHAYNNNIPVAVMNLQEYNDKKKNGTLDEIWSRA
jgi:hypothetical protein